MNRRQMIYAWGLVWGALSAICYAANPLGAVMLYQLGYGTSTVLLYRFGFAALILAAIMLVRRDRFRIGGRDLGVAVILGLLFVVCSQTFYESFRLMSVGIACTILFCYPVMTAVLMALFFHEKITGRTAGAIALAVAGIAVLSLGKGGNVVTASGLTLVLVSALAYAVYIVVVGKAHVRVPVSTLTFWAISFCFLGLSAYAAFTSGTAAFRLPASPGAWFWAVFLGLFPSVLALVFLAMSTRRIGSTPAAILGALEPVAAVAIGICLLGEVFTAQLAFGIVLVLAAVLLIVCRKPC